MTEGAYFDVRLVSERVVIPDVGREPALLGTPFEPYVFMPVGRSIWPKSTIFGLLVVELEAASLRRRRFCWGVTLVVEGLYDKVDSSYRVEDSAVETEALGDGGRRALVAWFS